MEVFFLSKKKWGDSRENIYWVRISRKRRKIERAFCFFTGIIITNTITITGPK